MGFLVFFSGVIRETGVFWRRLWDRAFGLSSFLASLLIGVILGNDAWAATTIATLLYAPRMAEPLRENPRLFLVPIGSVLANSDIPLLGHTSTFTGSSGGM